MPKVWSGYEQGLTSPGGCSSDASGLGTLATAGTPLLANHGNLAHASDVGPSGHRRTEER